MSDALDYLVKTRPEAMKAYFKFLKEAGKALDPKTRALITVITKVATQTENGFRQYLVRALQAGCTPGEILDAILQAFPALGLTKIVWAVEILLAMDLPQFRAENMGAEQRWHAVLAADKIPEGEITYCDADGRSLFIYRANGELRVYDSRCPHQVTNIPHLALEGFRLTCPKHHWAFDIKTGACVEIGDRPLTRFETKVENGRLYAYW
ncbi:MAG: carboxymuconolactone decarboxylase [Candidatus Muproteobacteria bacterium RIFCSPHIGHO2_02_FULL_65_16]|uniref:Carboxymuconolactone decarboxylase n=1 Tax=Candidatus Muproteobacteria bacterium RIFCSPHIGHO2_02_FULL_65_16 TaxID=1817766 RepID=A0A1F6U2R4_9PROT|nr:MAG: carboxymuconolactone decarboxylase [Candidatus Muproteobacteria bacterium RIFCSPHIGHO2_02_FULL_65_16]